MLALPAAMVPASERNPEARLFFTYKVYCLDFAGNHLSHIVSGTNIFLCCHRAVLRTKDLQSVWVHTFLYADTRFSTAGFTAVRKSAWVFTHLRADGVHTEY